MSQPTVYIAASWKHHLAVELLTRDLRNKGWEVRSFVENNHGEGQATTRLATDADDRPQDFDHWCASDRGERAFVYDTDGATKSDLVIYIGPSGIDAWAEIGAAWATGVPIIGLFSKGEQVGLMRRMVTLWVYSLDELSLYVSDQRDLIIKKRFEASLRSGS